MTRSPLDPPGERHRWRTATVSLAEVLIAGLSAYFVVKLLWAVLP